MPKKKFSETKVGKFLKGAAPKLLNIIGDVFPSVGILSKAKDLIQKDTNISKEDKDIALKLLEIDVMEMQEVTKRWESDMASDSWLSKNIRPLSLAFLTLTLFIYIILDSALEGFKIDSEWVSLLGNLLMLVYGGYFGARTLEKIRHN